MEEALVPETAVYVAQNGIDLTPTLLQEKKGEGKKLNHLQNAANICGEKKIGKTLW